MFLFLRFNGLFGFIQSFCDVGKVFIHFFLAGIVKATDMAYGQQAIVALSYEKIADVAVKKALKEIIAHLQLAVEGGDGVQ